MYGDWMGDNKIIINKEDVIICPNCNYEIRKEELYVCRLDG